MGHAAGDAVIKRFSVIARDVLGSKIVFGRVGGEEFAASLAGVTIDEARAQAEEVRAAFEIHSAADDINATVSVGISAGAFSETLDDQMALADRALYRSKQLGRNRVEAHVGSLLTQVPSLEPASPVSTD